MNDLSAAAPAMPDTYYKAVRPDGCSFHDSDFRWLPESGPIEGHVVTHRLAGVQYVPEGADAGRYLSVSVVATACTGMRWPCRLLEVEPVGGYPVVTPDPVSLPHKRAARAWRVVRELPAHEALGPQGEHVAALIERAASLTSSEVELLVDAWDAVWDAVWRAVRDAAWDAVRDAAWVAAWDAARDAAWVAARDAAWDAVKDAAWALIVRDLISAEHYDTFTLPWRTAVGRIHPDDPEVTDA